MVFDQGGGERAAPARGDGYGRGRLLCAVSGARHSFLGLHCGLFMLVNTHKEHRIVRKVEGGGVPCRAILQLLLWYPASTDTGLPAGWKTGHGCSLKTHYHTPLHSCCYCCCCCRHHCCCCCLCCCCCQVEHVKAERNVLAEVHNPYIVKLYYSFQVCARVQGYWTQGGLLWRWRSRDTVRGRGFGPVNSLQ